MGCRVELLGPRGTHLRRRPSSPTHSRRGLLLRTVAEDLDAAPPEADQQLLVARLRLDASAYQRLSDGISALLAVAEADQKPDAAPANLTTALYGTTSSAAGAPQVDVGEQRDRS